MPNRAVSELSEILARGAVGTVVQPEYGTIRTTTALFGLPRTELFRLIRLNAIRSIHYRKPGAQKGIRLIEFKSLREYLATFAK